MNKDILIKLDDVKKYFYLENWDEVRVLNWINLEIKSWEFVALMWESWSWKSTVLNVIACLFPLTKWKYYLDSEEIWKLKDDEILSYIRNKKIWFIFQQFHLIAEYNSLENVILPAIFWWKDKKERRQKAIKLLEKVWLKDKLYSKPWELSGWERQRVAIARSLINDPEILIADEPTWSLDSYNSIQIMELLKELNKKWKTIIMVTHSKQTAKYADRVIYLKDGKVVDKL